MKVQLLRQSKTFVIERTFGEQEENNKKIQRCDYVYVTDLPTNTGFDTADKIIDELENTANTEVHNIRLVLDDMTQHWTLCFSSYNDSLLEEYEFEIDTESVPYSMIVGFIKTMHTYIMCQPKRSSLGQNKSVDGFTYCFTTTIRRADMDWDGAYNVIVECIADVMQIPLDTIKDMEISLDIAAGLYTVRFSSTVDLTDTDYAAEVTWIVQSRDGGFEETVGKYPTDYANDDNYVITTVANPLLLDEVEFEPVT